MNKPHNPASSNHEIANANLFADDIVFSNTEKILFEEDLQDSKMDLPLSLMSGNPEQRYSATQKLNEGGMKTIWEVEDHRTARKVAMALIQDSKIASEQDIDTFLYEARLTANLQHPNIIPIYDIALDENGNPYFTMKALKGDALSEILSKLKQGDPKALETYTSTRLLTIFLKICNAISYAHSKGVIHLDIKPSNIIVGSHGDVHVLDWGLSTLITHPMEYGNEEVSWKSVDDIPLENGEDLTHFLKHSAQNRKRRNIVGGTPGYMSPEQATGTHENIDFRTDIYMLGAILHELLTLKIPVQGTSIQDILKNTVRGEIPPLTHRDPKKKISPALNAITLKALEKKPDLRYATVSELIRDIHKYQEGFATQAENPTFFTHVVLLIKRHKVAVSLIAASLFIIFSVLITSFLKVNASARTTRKALSTLQTKNEYIESTAKRVAPDYLTLMTQRESNFDFIRAEEALDTSLAFDPTSKTAWFKKGTLQLLQQDFATAYQTLSTKAALPSQREKAVLRLAKKYKDTLALSDEAIPQFVKDLQSYHLTEGIPRFFYHLNQEAFNSETRLPALSEALKTLNPRIMELNFSWNNIGDKGWLLDISNNPLLDDISPLCGLKLLSLKANNIGSPDLKLIDTSLLQELHLSNTNAKNLFNHGAIRKLKSLDISHSSITDLTNIDLLPQLTTLKINGIKGLEVPPQLVWSQQIRFLTVAKEFKTNRTLNLLAKRGVIIIYTDE